MTVQELIDALNKIENKNLEVLTADHDHWFYDTYRVGLEKIHQGVIREDIGTLCVVIT